MYLKRGNDCKRKRKQKLINIHEEVKYYEWIILRSHATLTSLWNSAKCTEQIEKCFDIIHNSNEGDKREKWVKGKEIWKVRGNVLKL